MSLNRYFATCARMVEPVLVEELRALGASDIKAGRGGVYFAGDRAMLYKANLWLRSAIRVLKPILEAHVESPDELYDAVQTIDWQEYMTPEHTLAVDCNVRDSHITHSQYASRRVKDAICDQFVSRIGRRPSVDPVTPMVGLNLHVSRDNAVLSLESSGESLHKRGYRPILTRAPLNEALAAALVQLTGYQGQCLFVDPLCGSGTLPIEAAWLALKRPPGLTRKRFGFQGWMDFDVELWTDLKYQSRKVTLRELPNPVIASDLRSDAVSFAIDNANAAGIGHLLRFHKRDFRDFEPPPGQPGILLCNPPYGERIGEEKFLFGLYRLLGQVFQERCQGWTAFVFTGNKVLGDAIGIQPDKALPLFNGKIPCRLLQYNL